MAAAALPVVFFWDMQNCAIPSKKVPFDIVASLRGVVEKYSKHLVKKPSKGGGAATTTTTTATQEIGFNSYVDVASMSASARLELSRARVNLRDVPSSKPAAADIRLLQDILHHTMMYRSGIIVLITGDIDFAETIHDLIHTGGYEVLLVHNNHARVELKKHASHAISFEAVCGSGGSSSPPQISAAAAVAAGATNNKNSNKGGGGKDLGGATSPATKNKTKDKKAVAPASSWTCEDCSKTFTSEASLDQHQESTGHATVTVWECGECAKEFATEAGCDQHQAATGHRDDHDTRVWECECRREFTSLESLRQHQAATNHAPSMSHLLANMAKDFFGR